LLYFDIPDEVINSDLDYARLILGRKKIQDEITLRLYCVTTSWEASTVSWNYPWERAGGDFDEYPVSIVHLYPEYFDIGKDYFFDVTEHIRKILEIGNNLGFIVLPNDEEISVFGSDVLSLFDDPTVITVKYFISGD